jgi:hypothetical protein
MIRSAIRFCLVAAFGLAALSAAAAAHDYTHGDLKIDHPSPPARSISPSPRRATRPTA